MTNQAIAVPSSMMNAKQKRAIQMNEELNNLIDSGLEGWIIHDEMRRFKISRKFIENIILKRRRGVKNKFSVPAVESGS